MLLADDNITQGATRCFFDLCYGDRLLCLDCLFGACLHVLYRELGRKLIFNTEKTRPGSARKKRNTQPFCYFEQLDRIFKNDSVQKLPEGESLVREYKVIDASGEPALIFVTRVENDSLKALEHVKIFSPDYATEKGISTASTFKDVSAQYTIDHIEPSFSSAILFIDELNATISLDKKDLKIDEFDMRDIREDQIPDLASIMYITLWFE